MDPQLPDDLILEIISRMAPRNVLQLFRLSKDMYSMLTSKYFISLHFNNFRRNSADYYFWRYSLELNGEAFALRSSGSFRILLHCPRVCCRTYDIAGIINGVVCLQSRRAMHWIFLWNPIIKRRLIIPPPPRPTAVRGRFFQKSLGFAYDSKRKDYKIFSIWSAFDYKGPIAAKLVLHVLPKKIGEWAEVQHEEDSKVAIVNSSWGAFLEGSCHWAVYGKRNDVCWERCFVLALDASNHSISLYEMPDAMQLNMAKRTTVGVVDGSLALIPQWNLSLIREKLIVWIMEEYGNASSWVRRYRVVGAVWDIFLFDGALLSKSGEVLYGERVRRNGVDEVRRVAIPHYGLYPHTFAESLELLADGHPRRCFCPT